MLIEAAKKIGGGAAAIGPAGAGAGTGTAPGPSTIGTPRNPPPRQESFRVAISGFASAEAMALFALMMPFYTTSGQDLGLFLTVIIYRASCMRAFPDEAS